MSVVSAFKTGGQKSRSFEEGSHDGSSYGETDRRYSVASRISGRRSHSESPTPQASQNKDLDTKLSIYGITKISRLPKNLNLKEQRRNRALTLKTVGKVIIGFIRQEKILRTAIGSFGINQSFNFDFKRFKSYVKRTRAFSAGLSKNREITLKAPGAVEKRNKAIKSFAAAVSGMTQVKKLTKKKGGFITSATPEDYNEAASSRQMNTPHDNFQDGRHGSGNPPSRYSEGEWSQRFQPEYGQGPGPYNKYSGGRGYPGPGGDPRNWGPKDEFEYSQRRDYGYDTMRSYNGRSYRDDYNRRGMDSNRSWNPRDRGWGPNERGRPPFRRGESYEQEYHEAAMQQYREEYENTPHGERYKLAPPDYRHYRDDRSPDRYRNRSYSPGDDRYLRLFDSSPEDTQRGYGGREDNGYYSGPSGAPESKESRRRSQAQGQGKRKEESPENQRSRRQKSDQRKRSKSDDRGKKDRYSKTDNKQRERSRTPEEYKWSRDNVEIEQYPGNRQRNEYMRRTRGYNDEYRRFPNPREEMAKMHAVAVYAAAMGGVNDDERGWS